MKTIGLDGESGTGKSTVAKMLAARGAVILPMDEIARSTYVQATSPGYSMVVDAFGKKILDSHGDVDTPLLGGIVFDDSAKREKLEGIVWPLAEEKIKNALKSFKERGVEIAVIEAAVLKKAGWDKYTNETWVIKSSRSLQEERLAAKGLSTKEAEARISAQAKEAEFSYDVTIDNNGTKDELSAKVDTELERFQKAA